VERRYNILIQQGSGLGNLLGELEREIMEIMWAGSSGSVRALLTQLNERRAPNHQLAYTTVLTIMVRLADKGLLVRRRVGKAHAYAVAETREAFLARASREIARHMVGEFGDAAIAGFLDALSGVEPDRLEMLRRKLQQRDEA
jgi:predicted transcriptional regulator